MPSDTTPPLSVVIPAYNEELRLPATLGSVIDYLSRSCPGAEIIVVDDGSSDGTANVVVDFSNAPVPVRLCRHQDGRNHGKGAAVRMGMLAARARHRLIMDADNSTSIDQIERFWPYFSEGFDIVIGSRNTEGSVVSVHQPKYKELAGRLGNLVIQMLAVPGIRDTQAGFKVFNGKSAEQIFQRLTIDRWGYDIEALVIARTLGYRIREVPITWINSPGSKVGLRSYFEVLAEVWRIRRNLRSGRYR
jgi:dolichyl-phosphate beta-glucosyltransferase